MYKTLLSLLPSSTNGIGFPLKFIDDSFVLNTTRKKISLKPTDYHEMELLRYCMFVD